MKSRANVMGNVLWREGVKSWSRQEQAWVVCPRWPLGKGATSWRSQFESHGDARHERDMKTCRFTKTFDFLGMLKIMRSRRSAVFDSQTPAEPTFSSRPRLSRSSLRIRPSWGPTLLNG